jgi:hypothetical protein
MPHDTEKSHDALAASITPKALHTVAQGRAAHPGYRSTRFPITPKALHTIAQGRAAHPGYRSTRFPITPKALHTIAQGRAAHPGYLRGDRDEPR